MKGRGREREWEKKGREERSSNVIKVLLHFDSAFSFACVEFCVQVVSYVTILYTQSCCNKFLEKTNYGRKSTADVPLLILSRGREKMAQQLSGMRTVKSIVWHVFH